MASSGSGVVRWIVNQIPTKNKLEEPYSIAKEISNSHWEADPKHEPGFFRRFETGLGLNHNGKKRGARINPDL